MTKQVLSLGFAAIQVASLAWISVCIAGPPALPRLPLTGVAVGPVSRVMASSPTNPGRQGLGARTPMNLDFRPPEFQKATDVFLGGTTRHLFAPENKGASALAATPIAKPMSPAEIFARRVHQEGLPVARLWENRTALVSVGLNQRGKPGLWLIQKTH
jgi:hypothetical protein